MSYWTNEYGYDESASSEDYESDVPEEYFEPSDSFDSRYGVEGGDLDVIWMHLSSVPPWSGLMTIMIASFATTTRPGLFSSQLVDSFEWCNPTGTRA